MDGGPRRFSAPAGCCFSLAPTSPSGRRGARGLGFCLGFRFAYPGYTPKLHSSLQRTGRKQGALFAAHFLHPQVGPSLGLCRGISKHEGARAAPSFETAPRRVEDARKTRFRRLLRMRRLTRMLSSWPVAGPHSQSLFTCQTAQIVPAARVSALGFCIVASPTQSRDGGAPTFEQRCEYLSSLQYVVKQKMRYVFRLPMG